MTPPLNRANVFIFYAITVGLAWSEGSSLYGQESSLFRQLPAASAAYGGSMTSLPAPLDSDAAPEVRQAGIGLPSASWTYTPPLQARAFRLQDIVTIRVDE